MSKKENLRLFWLLVAFGVLNIGYFLVQRLREPVVIVHTPLDDWIPFCEWFAIPYVIWYAYVFFAIVYFFFRERDTLCKMASMIVAGMSVCVLIFLICPNGIDFRPESFPRDNLLTDLVRLLYSNDQPENVFPSIHVLNSLAVHMAVHHSKTLREHRWVEWTSLFLVILISLSTVFIKQHSVVDIVGGTVLALALYRPLYCRKADTPVIPDGQEG